MGLIYFCSIVRLSGALGGKKAKKNEARLQQQDELCSNEWLTNKTQENGFFQHLHDIFQAQKYSEIALVVLWAVLFRVLYLVYCRSVNNKATHSGLIIQPSELRELMFTRE